MRLIDTMEEADPGHKMMKGKVAIFNSDSWNACLFVLRGWNGCHYDEEVGDKNYDYDNVSGVSAMRM